MNFGNTKLILGNGGSAIGSPLDSHIILYTNDREQFKFTDDGKLKLGTKGSIITTYQDSHLIFHTNNYERLRINDQGRVGIGTKDQKAVLQITKTNNINTEEAMLRVNFNESWGLKLSQHNDGSSTVVITETGRIDSKLEFDSVALNTGGFIWLYNGITLIAKLTILVQPANQIDNYIWIAGASVDRNVFRWSDTNELEYQGAYLKDCIEAAGGTWPAGWSYQSNWYDYDNVHTSPPGNGESTWYIRTTDQTKTVDYNTYTAGNVRYELNQRGNDVNYGVLHIKDGDVAIATINEGGSLRKGKVGIGIRAPLVALHMEHTDAIKIPKGTTAERPTANSDAYRGYIRYNTTLNKYEGYGMGPNWRSLEGVLDQDQDTYILAESTSGADNDELWFYTAGAERMIIKNDGRIGIEKTDPFSRLHIQRGTNSTTNIAETRIRADDLHLLLGGVEWASTSNEGLYIMGFGYVQTSSSYPPVYIGHECTSSPNNTFGDLIFGTRADGTNVQAAERMRIKSDGNIGIGTSTFVDTRSILHIKKNTGISFQADTDQTDSRNWRIRQDDYGALGSFQISVGSNNTDFGDSNSDVVMTMLKNRNVGIGTTNPDRKVHIVGDVRIEGSLTTNGETFIINTNQNNTERLSVTNDGTGPAIIANQLGSQPVVDFQDDGNSVFYIEDGGDIGINTNAPDVALHINHTDAIKVPKGTTAERPAASTDTHKGYVRYNTTLDIFEGFGAGPAWGSLGGVIDVDQDTYIKAESTAGADNDELWFYTLGSERMRILNNGNIGIGTTNPVDKLHINGGKLLIINNANSSGAGDGRILGGHSDNAHAIHFRIGEDGTTDVLDFHEYGKIRFYTNGTLANQTEKMCILSNGNIGIGITSPSTRLHVKDTTCILTLETTQGDVNGRYCYIDFKDSGGSFAWFGDGGGANKLMYLYLTDNQPFVITGTTESSTRVGIGTQSPETNLHVHGGSTGGTAFNNSVLLLSGTSTVNYGLVGMKFNMRTGASGAKSAIFSKDYAGTWNRSSLVFATNNESNSNDASLSDAKMVIRETGNVGIGTTSPAGILNVKGADPKIFLHDSDTSSTTADVQLYFCESDSSGNPNHSYRIRYNSRDLVFGEGDYGGSFTTAMALHESTVGGNIYVGIGNATPSCGLQVGTESTSSLLSSVKMARYIGFGYKEFFPSGAYSGLSCDNHATFCIGQNTHINNNNEIRVTNTHPTNVGTAICMPGNAQPNQGGMYFFTKNPTSVTAGNVAYDLDTSVPSMMINGSGTVGIGTRNLDRGLCILDNQNTGQSIGNFYIGYNSSYQESASLKILQHLPISSSTYRTSDGGGNGDPAINIVASYVGSGANSTSHLGGSIQFTTQTRDNPTSGGAHGQAYAAIYGGRHSGYTNYEGEMIFYTADTTNRASGANLNPRMTIKGGNVGIGTTSPNYALSFGTSEKAFALYENNGNYFYGMKVANVNGWGINFYTSSGNDADGNIRMSIKRDSGYVGVGTTSPAGKFHTVGSSGVHALRVTGNSGSSAQVYVTGSNYGIRVTSAASSGSYYSAFFEGSTGKGLYVRDDGYVGIGTTVPFGKLDIKHSNWTQTPTASTMSDMLNLMVSAPSTTGENNMRTLLCFADGYRNNSATKDSYRVRCRMSGAGFDIIWNSSATETLGSNTSDNNFIFSRDYTAFMNKNVGIGTTSPSTTLQIKGNGDSNSVQLLIENESYDKGIQFQYKSATGTTYDFPQAKIWTSEASAYDTKLHFSTAKGSSNSNTVLSTVMTLDDDGNVGIGTLSPSQLLHIFNTSTAWNVYANIRLSTDINNGNTYYGEIGYFRGTNSSTDEGLVFSGRNASRKDMVILSSNGNVGINDTTPSYKLDVNGDINFTGTLRQNGTEYGSGSGGSGDWECEVEWATGNAGGTRQVKVNGVQVNSGTNALNAIYLNKDGTYKGRSTGQYLYPGNPGAWNTEANEWNAQDNGTIIIVATTDWINAPATGGSAQTLLESIGALDAFNIPSDRVGYILAFIKGSYGCIEKLGNDSSYHNGKVFFSYYDLLNITSGQYNYNTSESPDFQLTNMHVGNLRSVGKLEVLPGSISGTAVIGKIRVGSWNYGSYDYMSIQHHSLGWSSTTGNFALRQDYLGNTDLNCATGKAMGFSCNNEYKMYMNSSGQFTVGGRSIYQDAKISATVPDEGTFLCSPDISQYIWRINNAVASAWGIYWSTNSSGNNEYLHSDSNPNQIVFVGSGTSRASIDLDNGDVISTGWYHRTAHEVGGLCGSYNSVGANGSYTNPIYTIGSNYKPSSTSLSNMYGIGYCHTDASFLGTESGTGWGLYVASDGDARWFCNGTTGSTYQSSWIRVGGSNGIYFQDYGGGWNMSDTSYIRSYGNKAVMIQVDNDGDNTLVEMLRLQRHCNDESSSAFAEGGYISMYITDDNDSDYEGARISFRSDNGANNETSGRLGFWTSNSGNPTQRVSIDKSGNMIVTGDITAYGSISDLKLKENIKELDTKLILDKVLQLKPVSFKWIDDIENEKRKGKNDEGFIAQDVEKLWPMLVDEFETLKEECNDKFKYIHYNKLTVYTTAAIQEQQKQINKLKQDKETKKKEITELRNENNMLKEQMKSVLERLAVLESK